MKISRLKNARLELVGTLGAARTASTPQVRMPALPPRDWLLKAQGNEEIRGSSPLSILARRPGAVALAFGRLREALEGLGREPPTPEQLDRVALQLGFIRTKTGKKKLHYARGKLELAVRPFQIGEFMAFQVSLKDGGQKKTAVLIGGVTVGKKLWAPLAERFQQEIDRFVEAKALAHRAKLPIDMASLKTFSALAEGKKARAAQQAESEALAKAGADLTAAITALKDQGRAPAGVVFYVEGPDGVGKSSTAGLVAEAIEAAGYRLRTERFKGPTAAERKNRDPMRRFQRGIPTAGEAVIWDRGPAGDVVYGNTDPAERARAMDKLERELRDQNILLIKVELHASPKKQAATFGKRLARQAIADELEARLAERGKLDCSKKAGLDDVATRIDGDDFRAMATSRAVQGRYASFIRLNQKVSRWLMIDTTHRHPARLSLIEGTGKMFEAFAAANNARRVA